MYLEQNLHMQGVQQAIISKKNQRAMYQLTIFMISRTSISTMLPKKRKYLNQKFQPQPMTTYLFSRYFHISIPNDQRRYMKLKLIIKILTHNHQNLKKIHLIYLLPATSQFPDFATNFFSIILNFILKRIHLRAFNSVNFFSLLLQLLKLLNLNL